MDSPGQESRVGDLHSACVADKVVAREHAEWLHSELREKIGTQRRSAPWAPLVLDGGGPVVPAWVTEGRSRILGQELAGEKEGVYPDLAGSAKARQLNAPK